MNRAVAIEVGDIGGPNHGIFCAGGVGRAAPRRSAAPRRAASGRASSAGRRRAAGERRGVDEAARGRPIASSTSASQACLVGRRGDARPRRSRPGARPGWRRPSPAAGVGVRQPASSRPATRPRARSPSAARSASTWSSRSVMPCSSAVVEGVRPSGRGSGCGGAVSSVIVLASPRPRTRSRVACTSSRTPGRDSSAPSSSTVIRWVSRPTRCSSGATAASSAGVGAGRDPQLERGGEDRAGEVVAEHLAAPRGCAAARAAGAAAASRSSAPRTSVRCSTAATTRSFLVGKWCSCAPRLTPARSETSVVDVPREAALDQAARPSPRAAAPASRGCAPPAARGPGSPGHRDPGRTNSQA